MKKKVEFPHLVEQQNTSSPNCRYLLYFYNEMKSNLMILREENYKTTPMLKTIYEKQQYTIKLK